MKLVHAIFSTIILIVFITVLTAKSIRFDINCGGHLKRAADANTVELAQQELRVAVAYLEENSMTRGFTSTVYNEPDEDIGFWYTNLHSSLNELNTLPADASHLEKSNTLMKLRETLLDEGKDTSITIPVGISRFPNNAAWGIGFIVMILWCCVAWILCGVE